MAGLIGGGTIERVTPAAESASPGLQTEAKQYPESRGKAGEKRARLVWLRRRSPQEQGLGGDRRALGVRGYPRRAGDIGKRRGVKRVSSRGPGSACGARLG